MNRLTDKTTIVTGGGAGIGEAISLRFAAEGARVVVVDRDEASAAGVVEAIKSEGGVAESLVLDVSNTGEVRAKLATFDCIDILVNNAGIASIGSLEDTSPEELDRVYSVNVKGVYNCLYAVVPEMKKRGQGVVLNMASIASRLGIQDRFAYSMSKGAVLSMTLSVARDYLAHGIRCNCICPARVHTPFVDAFLDEHFPDNKEEMFAKLSEYQPIGRMGKPEEVAALAAFLCSDEAAFITGASYDIDGGVMQLK